MKGKKIDKAPLFFAGLLILTAMVLYFTPKLIQTAYFVIILVIFWKTKFDYLWLVFALVMTQDIGGAFYSLTSDIVKIGPVEVSYLYLFTIVSFLKYYKEPNKSVFLFKKPVIIYLVYLFFLMFLGFFIYGNDGGGRSGLRYYFLTFFFLITALNLFTVPKILNSFEKIKKFASLIFVAIILNLIGQIFHVLNGAPLYLKFGDVTSGYREIDFVEKLVRPVWGHAIILIGISLAMFFYLTKNNNFKKGYLNIIILVSILSVFIGATRGWIISLSFLLIAFLTQIKLSKSVLIISVSVAVLYIMLSLNSSVRVQFSNVFERLSTLEKLAKGDLTAGGTNVRLTTRSHKVMEVFYMHPIFGTGFSNEGMDKNDQHVGNQNILMAGGLVGFLIILYFWIYIIHAVIKYRNRLSYLNKYKRGLVFIISILITSLLIHSSSTSLYGYLAYVKSNPKFFFVIIFITILNQLLLTAISYERALKVKRKNYEGA